MSAIACKAYLKATTPQNIQAAFKKTGIYPFKKDAIHAEDLYTAESFREKNPVKKAVEMKGGKEEVQKFIDGKMDALLGDTKKEGDCEEKWKNQKGDGKKLNKSSAGGKAITEGDFGERLEEYIE